MASFLLAFTTLSEMPIFGGDLLATKNEGVEGCFKFELAFDPLWLLCISIGLEGSALDPSCGVVLSLWSSSQAFESTSLSFDIKVVVSFSSEESRRLFRYCIVELIISDISFGGILELLLLRSLVINLLSKSPTFFDNLAIIHVALVL